MEKTKKNETKKNDAKQNEAKQNEAKSKVIDWDSLGISNDFIFAKVMQNPDICKELLEIILDIKIDHIEYPEVEKTVKLSYDGKGVRLDVYAADEKKTVYNVEMQAADTKEIPQRSRYYQGIIDMELIERGTAYKELNQSYVIFICRFDLFGKGRCRYTFEERCVEDTSVRLDDGATRIFLNTKGIMEKEDISDDLREFLEYVEGVENENPFVKKVDEQINVVKNNKKLRREYMNQVVRDQLNRDEGYAEGHDAGIERGIEQGVIMLREIGVYNDEIARKLVERFHISEDKAWEYVKK